MQTRKKNKKNDVPAKEVAAKGVETRQRGPKEPTLLLLLPKKGPKPKKSKTKDPQKAPNKPGSANPLSLPAPTPIPSSPPSVQVVTPPPKPPLETTVQVNIYINDINVNSFLLTTDLNAIDRPNYLSVAGEISSIVNKHFKDERIQELPQRPHYWELSYRPLKQRSKTKIY